jgi:hypothetical protein
VPAVSTFDPRRAIIKDTTGKDEVGHFHHIWPEEPVLLREMLVIDLLKRLEIYLAKCRFAALLWRI